MIYDTLDFAHNSQNIPVHHTFVIVAMYDKYYIVDFKYHKLTLS